MMISLRSWLVALVAGSVLGPMNLRAATPLAQDYTVVFHNPDPEYYVEGPGLVRSDDGTLIAIVPVVPREEWSVERRAKHSITHILRSHDGGKSWQETSSLPYYSAAPFIHRGALYLLVNKGGTKSRNDDVLILRSDDGGTKWSEPVTLFKGHYWNCHTAMVQKEDKLYWATDDLSLGKNRGPCLIAGDLSKDAMDPMAWRISKPVPFPGEPKLLIPPKFAAETNQYLEPNVIEFDGKLRVLSTVKIKRQTLAGLCAVFDATDDGQSLQLNFQQYSPMPCGQLKFCVLRDEISKLFWVTGNQPADSQRQFEWGAKAEKMGNFKASAGDRRFLMLQYSVDALNWFPAGCIAHAAKISQSFMYARPVIDGEDLAIICRSSVNAPNQHDADYATFHRVKDFRRLALKLVPAAE